MSFIPITQTTLSTMQLCPRQYEAKYILKTLPYEPSAAAEEGQRAHKALEEALTLGAPMPPEFQYLTPYANTFLGQGGTVRAETKFAIDHAGNPSDWYARHMGGIADVVVLKGDHAFVGDLKTGKFNQDRQQLTILTKCLLANYPHVNRVSAALFFPKVGKLFGFKVTREAFTHTSDAKALEREVKIYERVLDAGEFKPKPNGLCKQWCGVLTCEHNGRAIDY